MISCIFTTAFYTIVIFADAITNITTIISNLQTNFCFIPRAQYRVFQIVISVGGESKILLGEIFLPSGENLRRSDFGNTNLFQSEKSILWVLNINSNQNYIVWPVCHEIKTKMVQEQRLQLKMTFYWVITWLSFYHSSSSSSSSSSSIYFYQHIGWEKNICKTIWKTILLLVFKITENLKCILKCM